MDPARLFVGVLPGSPVLKFPHPARIKPGETKPCEIHVGDSVMGFYAVDMKWYPAKVLKVLEADLLYIMYDVYNNKEIRTRGHVLVEGEDPVNIK